MKHRRRAKLVSAGAVVALVLASFIPASAASAYTKTGCKWSSSTVRWNGENIGSAWSPSAVSAALSWANYSDVNGMTTTSSAVMYGYEDNAGPSGYAGRTTWTCLGGAYLDANVTINPYYANSYNTAKRRAAWVHEFGHALGLDHGPSNALMNTCAPCVYENYGYYFPRPDDVAGMNSIY